MHICILGCTKTKLEHPAPASELYSASPYFRACLAYARQRADKIIVLSAKLQHCAIDLDEDPIIEPYDRTLSTLSPDLMRQWQWHAAWNLRNVIEWPDGEELEHFAGCTIEILAGKDYASAITANPWGMGEFFDQAEIIEPMAGLGIGERKGWLKAHTKEVA